jgi:hypothetical protein
MSEKKPDHSALDWAWLLAHIASTFVVVVALGQDNIISTTLAIAAFSITSMWCLSKAVSHIGRIHP